MSSSNDEYILGWNDHGNNFSISFDDLLQGNELVDVQLVAEGNLIGAHRLVLSAMSPYFRKIFTQMPVNQQAYVFLKDISKQTMEDLITFIYRGEVNVKHESLEEFMNFAIALNIKGLADGSYSQSFKSCPYNSTPAELTYNGSVYQNSDFNHSFGSAGVQYQSIQRSAQHQQPMKKYEKQDGFDFDDNSDMNDGFGYDSKFNQNYGIGKNNNNNNNNHSMNDCDHQWESEFQFESDGSIDNCKSSEMMPTIAKRTKRKIDLSAYEHSADIRTINGRENLYHENYKFCKHGKPSSNLSQRWVCTKQGSEKCPSIMYTIEINGIIMMKIAKAKHSHQP